MYVKEKVILVDSLCPLHSWDISFFQFLYSQKFSARNHFFRDALYFLIALEPKILKCNTMLTRLCFTEDSSAG